MSYDLVIDGDLVAGDLTLDVVNPATGEVAVRCSRATQAQADRAIAAAKRAFPAWAATPSSARKETLKKIADIVDAHRDELAALITLENGKPVPSAQREVMGLAGMLRWQAGVDISDEVIERSETREVSLRRTPLGVVAIILPWNFPLAILGFKVAAALATGNAVVIKPAATTPLSALRFGALVRDILPPGVINVIADDNDLGEHIARHKDVRKVTFTGSTATGRKVMAGAAGDLKRLTLELGGNDPAIVLDDADPAAIARGLFDGAFRNSGQVCIAIKRLYVHESIYDAVCNELAALANEAVVGDGAMAGVQFGPVQNRLQFEKLRALLEEAKSAGRIMPGGGVVDGPGYFIRPTIVRDVREGTRLVDEEQFGPILPVMSYADLDDAIERANAGVYGLGASVWSSDVARAKEVALRLEAGTVWINKHMEIAPHIPSAGAKQSGVGVEFGREGLLEFTQIQVINSAVA